LAASEQRIYEKIEWSEDCRIKDQPEAVEITGMKRKPKTPGTIAQIKAMVLANPGMSVSEARDAVYALPEHRQQIEANVARQKKTQNALKRIVEQFIKTTGVELKLVDGKTYYEDAGENLTMKEDMACFDFWVRPEDAAEVYNMIKPFLRKLHQPPSEITPGP
jgi:hypothetical protein